MAGLRNASESGAVLKRAIEAGLGIAPNCISRVQALASQGDLEEPALGKTPG